MNALQRQANRIAAGREDVTSGLVQSPGWLLTLQGGAPQAGSVGYRSARYAHHISEAVADGGVITQDRQVYEALMGLGVYQAAANPTPLSKYAQTVLKDNPISYWRLDETSGTAAADLMAVNPGTYTGTETLNQTGALTGDTNASVLFGGGYVSVSDAPSLRLTGDMTLEAWVKASNLTGNFGLIGKTSGDFAAPYIWFVGNGQMNMVVGNGATQTDIQSTSSLTVGPWWHVVATISGLTVSHYISGQARGSGSIAGQARADAGSAVRLASAAATWIAGFVGQVDEFAVYNYALSPAQVLNHYNVGLGN